LHDLDGRDVLDAHQLEAVAAATHHDVTGLCLFDEQGLGKTVMALFAFHRLRQIGDATKMLVIAPKNMVSEWAHDTTRFFNVRYRVVTAVGSEREKRRALGQPADIYVTNFETAVSLSTRLRELLEAERSNALLVVDESFFVKNRVTRRAQGVRGLRRSVRRCIVLCGTPAPNSPHDLVEQFNVADGGTAFHGIALPPEREAARPVVRGIISERGVFIRRLKQDVLPDLPDKTFHRVLVPLEPEQARAYAAALRALIADLRRIDDVTFKKRIPTFLAQRVVLLQICSHPRSVVADYRETPAKIRALDSILEELIERRQEKVVVWSFFTASLEALLARYSRFDPVRCDGTVTRAGDRREAVRRFQEDSRTMLFVGNPAAAGTGLTLHRARYAVYESMSNQAAHYLQSLDRIHRRGQTRAVEYLVLLCDRTIEVKEYDRLIRKEEAAQVLLGDDFEPPITRTTMLREAVEAAQALGLHDADFGVPGNAACEASPR
jgi:SNF2 family DNA or RNA helicase